jgi:hypothetical protein
LSDERLASTKGGVSESKLDTRSGEDDVSLKKKESLEKVKGLNFVRAPHHVPPLKSLEKGLEKISLDSSERSDPFAKKKLLGGK